MTFGLLPACVFAALLAGGAAAAASRLGDAPPIDTASRNAAATFRLPAIHDGRDDAIGAEMRALQVGQRARRLQLDLGSAHAAWTHADVALQGAERRLAALRPRSFAIFPGQRASQLNAVLRSPAGAAVRVTSAHIDIDEPIVIGRSGTWLDLGTAALRAGGSAPAYLLRIERASSVTVEGGAFVRGRWGALVDGAADATLRGGRYEGLRDGGVAISGSQATIVAGSRFTGNGGAAVLVHGDARASVLLRNEIIDNGGASNWHAGIVVTDRNAAVAEAPERLLGADGYGVPEQPITERLRPPRRTVIAYNRISGNASSGIYSDGGVESVFYANVVDRNAKEGICLDNGSTANVVVMNTVRSNGKRWGKSELDLTRDFVAVHGRLTDGSAAAKVPGISLDNALYNVVFSNIVDRNHGGGIKMVRTAYMNVIASNTVTDNNQGASDRFHFFGIELGAARADVPVRDLDFKPSRGNLVVANAVHGSHYAGIFFGDGSTGNEVADNSILGATTWALEQTRAQANRSRDNLTRLPSRNIDNGVLARPAEPARTR